MSSQKPDSLETIIKLITILTIICYLIGVFTVNSYLYHLGISSLLSPLKTRFIYTGIVVLSSLSFSFSPWYFINKIFQKTWQKSIKIIVSICPIIVPVLVYLFINYLFVVVVENPGVIVLNQILSLIIVLYYSVGSFLTGIVIGLFLQAFFPDFSKEVNIEVNINFLKIENKSQKFLLSFLLIPVLSSYITFFGYRVYPLIPEQFGGGQPKIVQLLFKNDETSEIRQALTKKSTSLPTLALLFEEEKYYLIGLYTKKTTKKIIEGETKDEKVLENIIQIDRDLVTGIRLIKSRIRYSLSYVLDLLNFIFFRSNS